MPIQLSNFFIRKGYLDNIDTYTLSSTDLHTARNALMYDIDSFVTNGLLSFSSAIHSLNNKNYSWSFIQSYYSLFFFARAFNGIYDYAIVYKDSKPFAIKIQPGENFSKLKGNSHDVVFNQYKKHFFSDILLVNNIEGITPVEWFNKNRNYINYTLNPQTDPIPPIDLFDYKTNLRKWLVTYFGDDAHQYTFDPKHCYISYPLQVFFRIYNYYIDNDLKIRFLNEDQIGLLSRNFSDEKGPMPTIISKIKELSDF